MKVVIAPDSFKGTVTATDAARALADGWRSVRPDDRLTLRPMADGGEGTLAAVAAAHPGTALTRVGGCTGPDGRPVDGEYALLPDGTAVVELATTSGLPLMAHPAPLTATTRGTGELIAAALDHGATRLLIGLGGSASTDGGTGLLAALGLRVLDADGTPLPDGGGTLTLAHRIDRTRLRAAPSGGVRLLTDVTNPLLGPDGAAAVYGPQKGAGPEEIDRLEAGLTRLSELLGGNPDQPGAGAAGGTAYGLAAVWDATVTPGAAAVADLLGLDAAIADADLVITGEGRFDATSRLGKAVGEVLDRAARAGVPSRVVAGESADPAALTLTALAGSAHSARSDAAHWLRRAGAELAASAVR
ncbi:glycerate kinase [Kitasatospora paracochleata]|uniref:Glycerate kinase n=1 Tax=Kitasatospora paracochleata TaxID=58354 RepID=A0ABT1IWG4_9ACTN|nr:glycerate kinase [Kitasatospora paracochleata]MCP2309489.1 glycerate kinase [Kitasatospora paracochleata]